MRIDAHTHVWQAAESATPGIQTAVSPQCDVSIELLAEYLDEHQITRAVLVQPLFRGEDNSYVADCAARSPDRFRAVCVVDAHPHQAAQQLSYWVVQRGCRGVRLRPRVAGESDVLDDAIANLLFEAAAELGVVVSLLASQEHLSQTAILARRFPSVAIVIDHLAHPDPTQSVQQTQRSWAEVCRCENVFAKLSGYYYFSQQRYPFRDCHALIRLAYDSFGPNRLVWGSDFPHVLLNTGYTRSASFLEDQFAWLTSTEREAILGGNADRLYWPDSR